MRSNPSRYWALRQTTLSRQVLDRAERVCRWENGRIKKPDGWCLCQRVISVGLSMIKFRCDSCNKKIGVQDDYMGRRVWCPTCNSVAQVPQSPSARIGLADERDSTQYSVFLCREITTPVCEEPEVPALPVLPLLSDTHSRSRWNLSARWILWGCIVAAGLLSFLIFLLGARA